MIEGISHITSIINNIHKTTQLLKKCKILLYLISFNSIWEGFRLMDFALYNSTTVYMADGEIPYDNRFLGNTSITFNGKQLAIWKIVNEKEVNVEELVAGIVHEMFHSYQFEQGESRYPNDLVQSYCYR